jgi:DNA-binding LytR/AlgR family response regulator
MLLADKEMHKVAFDSVLLIEGMGDYVKIHTIHATLIVHMTLQKLQEQLPPNGFPRVHKSFIIALSRLEYVEGNMAIVNKREVPIGQTYRSDFLALLQNR